MQINKITHPSVGADCLSNGHSCSNPRARQSDQDDQVIYCRGNDGGDAQGWEPRLPGAIQRVGQERKETQRGGTSNRASSIYISFLGTYLAPTLRKYYFAEMVNGTLMTYCGQSWPFWQMALP